MNPYKNFTGAGLMALSGFLFFILALPSYNEISNLGTVIQQRQEILTGRMLIIDHLKDLRKQYQQRASDIDQLSSVVPDKKSLAEIVSTIEDVSKKTGIQLISSDISSPINKDAITIYNMLTIQLNLAGSYPSLINFLKELEKNMRLTDVFSLSASKGAAPEFLTFTVRANAYYLK